MCGVLCVLDPGYQRLESLWAQGYRLTADPSFSHSSQGLQRPPWSALCIISSLKGLSLYLALVGRAATNVLELWFASILCWKAYLKEQR